MAAAFQSIIEKEIDRLFDNPEAAHMNPVNGAINWAREPIEPQKKAAIVPLLAREWFAVYGPPDAPCLPISHVDKEDYRNAGGLKAVVGYYARSLDRQNYDFRRHPPFEDFVCGLMSLTTGRASIDNDENLKRRFPPRPLAGMTSAGFWDPSDRTTARFAA